MGRSWVPYGERRESIIEYVLQHPYCPVWQLIEWALAKRLANKSALYGDIGVLVDAGKLLRFPGLAGYGRLQNRTRHGLGFLTPGRTRTEKRMAVHSGLCGGRRVDTSPAR
jgi:hypothetical protein